MSTKREPSLIHLNGNILCAIDCETTGLDPNVHEIVEVCFLPLNSNLEPRRDIVPFDIQIRPENLDIIDFDAFKINKIDFYKLCQTAMDKHQAADLFESWANKLNLAHSKRISPLAHNWLFDAQFIKSWLGPKTYEFYIDGRYRDTLCASLYENDKADRRAECVPFSKVNLTWLATTLKIEHERAHTALGDCLVTAQVYRDMVRGHSPQRI